MSQPAFHLAPHCELFVKLLGAEEEDLAEGERHVMGDHRVRHRPDPGHRFLHPQISHSFPCLRTWAL